MAKNSAQTEQLRRLLGSAGNYRAQEEMLMALSGAGYDIPDELAVELLGSRGNQRQQTALLDAIRTGRQSRYASGSGGSGRSSSTPHFAPIPSDRSQIEFTDHSSGQTFIVDEPGPKAAAELAKRQAMRDELLMEQEIRTLGELAKGTSADAQTARQILGIPVTDEFHGLMTLEEDQVIQDRIRAEAAQRSQLEKYVSQPFVTEAQRDEVWAQHQAQFPEFANGQRPKTRAEQIQEMKARKLAQYQQALPDIPLDYDEKGQITVLPGFAEAQRARADILANQRAIATAAQTQRDNDYKRRLDVIKSAYPDGGPEYVREQINLYRQFYGNQQQPVAQPQPPAPPEPGSGLPVNRAQFDMYRQRANAEGIPLVADQDDYDALEPGEFFIDTADGQKYQKPPRE